MYYVNPSIFVNFKTRKLATRIPSLYQLSYCDSVARNTNTETEFNRQHFDSQLPVSINDT
jgi:hypothetical protein